MAAGPAKFVHEGESIDYTPGADVLTGAVVVQAELVGVAQGPIKANQLGSLAVSGVFDFPKALGAGSALPAGSNAYWDAGAQNATKNAAAGANKLIGKTVKTTVDATRPFASASCSDRWRHTWATCSIAARRSWMTSGTST